MRIKPGDARSKKTKTIRNDISLINIYKNNEKKNIINVKYFILIITELREFFAIQFQIIFFFNKFIITFCFIFFL